MANLLEADRQHYSAEAGAGALCEGLHTALEFRKSA